MWLDNECQIFGAQLKKIQIELHEKIILSWWCQIVAFNFFSEIYILCSVGIIDFNICKCLKKNY